VKLSVLVPVYNEEATVAELLRRVAAVPIEKELLVVDDASTDGTGAILAGLDLPGLRVFRHERNRGKGAALRTALAHAVGEIVIIQDADLEYDPNDYARLIEPIERGQADVVYGSRFLAGRRVTTFWHYFVNTALTRLSNLLTGLRLTDMETCYKVFRADLIRGLTLVSDGFAIEPEMTAKAARRGARFVEVPISYRGRGRDEGKKIHWRDGFRTLAAIARFHRFTREA